MPGTIPSALHMLSPHHNPMGWRYYICVTEIPRKLLNQVAQQVSGEAGIQTQHSGSRAGTLCHNGFSQYTRDVTLAKRNPRTTAV